ncbi:MAG: TMEM165/GDT1 family protein [Tissierellia bacterium]|nr:TMEM165/GDT1 family protein [Tissierellia bacterium]
MILELSRAFLLIFAAEMGDKSQVLAMAFATQYGIKEVLLGISIGVFLNHSLAIILGRYLSRLAPMSIVEPIAGIMFIIFGLLALLNEEELRKDGEQKGLGPVMTVAMAFFICELGDKTQLMAMTLSAGGNYPVFILAGTTLGMLATSGMAIFVGSKVGDRIPDILIKIISSLVFVLFGTLKLYSWLPEELLSPFRIAVYLIAIVFIQWKLIIRLIKMGRRSEKSQMKEVAATLYRRVRALNEIVDDICLGEHNCGCCSGQDCIIGCIRELLARARYEDEYYIQQDIEFIKLVDKGFDRDKVIEALSMIIADYMRYGVVEERNFIINEVKESFEIILFGEKIEFDGELQEYIDRVKRFNQHTGEVLQDRIESKIKIHS